MAESIQDAQNRVLALNSDDRPFFYEPTAVGIHATWKYADQKWQSGSQKSFTLNKSFAPLAESKDRQGTHTGQFFGYRFDTDEIKQPLIDALTAAGYSRKKGFFGKLFGG